MARQCPRLIRQYIVVHEFSGQREDELKLRLGEVVVSAERFEDGWMRGIRIRDLAVGFFPSAVVRRTGEESMRTRVAEEILSTEEFYLENLIALDQYFATPLEIQSIVSTEEFGMIFSTIKPLVGLSRDFYSKLKARLKTWDHSESKLGDLFLQLAPFFRLFGSHAVGYTSALEVQRRLKNNDKFTQFLAEAEVESGHILSSLLIGPIQRVPRYELLLKELLKHTEEDHPDYADLMAALTTVQKVALDINESIRTVENELQLIVITKRFPHDQVHLIDESRQFYSRRLKSSRTQSLRALRDSVKRLPLARPLSIPTGALLQADCGHDGNGVPDFGPRQVIREGAVQLIKAESKEITERHVFLLNDLVLIAQLISKTKPQYKLKDRSLLAQVWISDGHSYGDQLPDTALVVGTPTALHKIILPSVEEKNQWFHEITKYVKEQKLVASHVLKNLGIPDQTFYTCLMRSRIEYRGSEDFELRLKNGSDVSVLGIIGDGGKWRPSLFSNGTEAVEHLWWYGSSGNSFGWFPCGCVMEADKGMAAPECDELKELPMKQFLKVRKKFAEWTGQLFSPLQDRVVKVHSTDNSYKALLIPDSATAADVIKMYQSRHPSNHNSGQVSWCLREVSTDQSVNILLSPDVVLAKRMDSWGCCKDKMQFQLEEQILE